MPAASPPPDWVDLARFVAGECSAADVARINTWLEAHPAERLALTRLADGVEAAFPPYPAAGVDVEAALARVRVRRDHEMPGDVGQQASPYPSQPRRLVGPAWVVRSARGQRARTWRRVGGLLGTVAVGAFAARAVVSRGGARARPAFVRSYATAVGRTDSLRLPDGTRVILAPASQLQISAGYGGDQRDVTLVGAAWFTVRHDARRPFTVRAGGATLRDLGTEFAVRTDRGNGASGEVAVVAVIAGAVAVRHIGGTGVLDAPETVVRAGERAEVSANRTVQRGAVSASDTGWAGGRLVYAAAPLSAVWQDLHRWYGVDVRVSDQVLAGRRLTADLDTQTPVDDVLAAIAGALGAEVLRAGRTAVLRPRGAATVGPR